MSSPALGAGPRVAPVKTVIMALIFPLFMALALPGVYLAAFHHPVPTHMAVDVIATGKGAAQSTEIAQQLSAKAGKALDVTTVTSTEKGRSDVHNLKARGAYDPSTGTLYVASAGSALAEQSVVKTFTKVAAETKATLTVKDLAPLPSSDSSGLTTLFMGLGGILAGYISATVLGMGVKGLPYRKELPILAGVSVAAGIVTSFFAYSLFGALQENIVLVGLMVACGAFTTSLVQSGGLKLIGPGMNVVGVSLFIILGVTSSGAAVPSDMTPMFFQNMHHLLSTPAILDTLRRVLYFHGVGISPAIVVMILWALIGVGMTWIASLKDPAKAGDDPMAAILDAEPVAPAAPAVATTPMPAGGAASPAGGGAVQTASATAQTAALS